MPFEDSHDSTVVQGYYFEDGIVGNRAARAPVISVLYQLPCSLFLGSS